VGKRSNFERIPRDFYPTPLIAALPLLRHLPQRFSYIEPCAGDGALIDALACGRCVWAGDIKPGRGDIVQRNALECNDYNADFIITNPPWDRKILHPMIAHFASMRPTWLLFDADWVHTRQSASYMPWLRKIVSVGRIKWIPESTMTGKDNCAWHLFDSNAHGATEFIGRLV